MSESVDNERIGTALQMLYEEGLKFYKDEYKAEILRYRAIGKAIAQATQSARDYLNLAYEALEEWNYHSINMVIEWMYSLYGQTFHERDLQRLAKMIDKNNVTILTAWNTERADYDTKRVNVRVVIEEVTDTE